MNLYKIYKSVYKIIEEIHFSKFLTEYAGHVTNSVTEYPSFSSYIKFEIRINWSKFRK